MITRRASGIDRIAVIEAVVAGSLCGALGAVIPTYASSDLLGGTWTEVTRSWPTALLACIASAGLVWFATHRLLEGEDYLPLQTGMILGAVCVLVACAVGTWVASVPVDAPMPPHGVFPSGAMWWRRVLLLAALPGCVIGCLIAWFGRKARMRR